MQFAGREPGQAGRNDQAVEPSRPELLPVQTALTPATLLALQRSAGNAAVTGMLARDPAPAAPAPPVTPAAPPTPEAEFMSRTFPRKTILPDTGGVSGAFDAEYQPVEGVMRVTVRVGYHFESGSPDDKDWLAAVGGPKAAAKYTREDFAWTKDEQAKFQANALAKVQAVWQGRYRFYTQKAGWDRLPPVNVEINVEAVEGAELNLPRLEGGPHHLFWIRKYPTEPNKRSGFHGTQDLFLYEHAADGGAEEPDDSRHTVGPERDEEYLKIAAENPRSIMFSATGDEVTGEQARTLRAFAKRLADPIAPPFPINVTGHVSSSAPEETALSLSERRANNVANELTRGGAKGPARPVGVGKRDATAPPEGDYVDVALDNFISHQSTIAHEFGHIFGLSDEYPEPGDGRKVGDKAKHSDKVEKLIPGAKEVRAHHSEDIMSVGEVVRPHHYAGFLSALAKLTETPATDWGVGPVSPQRMPD